MGTEMLDTQFAAQMTGLPGGLSEVIAKQLERQIGEPLANMAADAAAVPNAKPAIKDATVPLSSNLSGRERQIVLKRHDGAAKAAEAATGIPASFMVAQAAHESGWGRHEIKNSDGSTSFNVFGIKAGGNWKGPTTEVTTTEVVDGQGAQGEGIVPCLWQLRGVVQRLRLDDEEQPALRQGGEPAAARRAGLCARPAEGRKDMPPTRPMLEKLTRMINTTLRLQRVHRRKPGDARWQLPAS